VEVAICENAAIAPERPFQSHSWTFGIKSSMLSDYLSVRYICLSLNARTFSELLSGLFSHQFGMAYRLLFQLAQRQSSQFTGQAPVSGSGENAYMQSGSQTLLSASVLIVDADQNSAHDLERELSSRGYRCVTVASGREALAAARKTQFDVAVIDMKLHDLDGYQLIPLLKDVCRKAKVIFSTPEHNEQIEKTARQTGIVFYAIKANNMLEILSAVSSAIRAKRKQDESERMVG